MIKKIMKHHILYKAGRHYHEISFFSSISSSIIQSMIGPCHKQINEQLGQPKIHINAFEKQEDDKR